MKPQKKIKAWIHKIIMMTKEEKSSRLLFLRIKKSCSMAKWH